jgi:ubiquinone/menaquinone biosynthesis C-methylase UbiE
MGPQIAAVASPKRSSQDDSRQRERAFFDQLANEEGNFNPFMDRGWRRIERRFCEMVRPTGASFELLDVGCGTGKSRQIYIGHVSRYLGVDLSAASIDLASSQYPQDRWEVADACDLPFDDCCFDAVAFSSVLHHIPDFPAALRQAYRVLKPGGKVFAFDPNLLHPAMALFRHPRSPLYLSKGVSPNECPLLPRVLRDAFRAAAFEDIQQRCQSDIPYRQVAPKLVNALLSLYNLADWCWEHSGLGRWFGTFIITAATKPNRG